MRRMKIGIRTQLILLVAFASLFSLLILAIVCGVYFSDNLSDLRAERLEVISQLKNSQVSQAVNYIFYQVYWLTTRDAITQPLTSFKAGNNSESIFQDAQVSLDQFLTSSESFASARLYNLDLDMVAESFNNVTTISTPALDYLYPLGPNVTVPSTLAHVSSNDVSSVYYTGPVSNSSDADSAYFIGITYPIFANTSIILTTPSVAGYLTVLSSASNIQAAVNDSSSVTPMSQSTKDYNVLAIEPVFKSGASIDVQTNNQDSLIGFQAVFPADSSNINSNRVYSINDSSAVKDALYNGYGSSVNCKNVDGESVAIGYSKVILDESNYWSVIIEQKKSTFNEPVTKLQNIIIGVSIGIGVFMVLTTFPLAVLFIRPITKLKNATEAITNSKRRKDKNLDLVSEKSNIDQKLSQESPNPSSTPSPPPPYYSTLIRRMNPRKPNDYKPKRQSVLSAGTGGSNSVYSTGIRLPSHIQHTKSFFKDELTELTEAFNIMREELEKQYIHLEDRVKSRTKELEASKIEAEAANEAKTVFIANISHELRTPLNGILGMTSIAMDEHSKARIKDSLKLIHRSGELLLHILTELLTYSKNTLNRSKLEKSSFQVLEVVYQVQSIFSKLANDQRVNFKILVKPNVIRKLILYGDSNRLIQVVMNLVSNSLKFTPVDGRVGVNFKLLGEYDFERSQADDFEHVYVTNSSKNNTNGEPSIQNNNPYDKLPPQKPQDASIKFSGDELGRNSNDNDNDNDNVSVLTLSTNEYENVVFQSQFNNQKPLPQLPSHPEVQETFDSSHDGDDDNDNANNKSSIDGTTSVKNNSKSDNIITPDGNEEADDIKELLPPPNMRDINDSNLTNSATDTTKRPSVSSLGSSINSHELVKNNKAYKIRNLYKSKSWVIQIEVSDTGPGIEPALQEKVFEPFIQGDQTLSRSYGGTGLGLSICRQLAKMMKGTLTLKSTIGAGSTFIFTVPLPQVGEILIPDEDLDGFCEDEFNPKSKVNRKVAFNTYGDQVINEGSHDVSDSDNGNGNDNGNDMGDVSNESKGVGSSSGHNNTTNKPNHLPMPPRSNSFIQPDAQSSPEGVSYSPKDMDTLENSTDANNDNNVKPPPTFTIDAADRSNTSDEGHSGSDNGGMGTSSKRPTYEAPPHLVTRGSTGTANSSSGSDKLEAPSFLLKELSHMKILVAEDNMVNQEVIKRMLKLEGFENIVMACNGVEAVEFVQESIDKNEMFDLIFMDVQMPKIDGLSATKLIRTNLQYDKPIIALTAFAEESNVKECLNSGMSGFLAKPMKRPNLRRIIIEFSSQLLSESVTTPHSQDDNRLGYDTSHNNSTQQSIEKSN